MTELHARLDVLEGVLSSALVGGAAGVARRSFAVLELTRDDGGSGIGEASPLPGYSPDDLTEVVEALRVLVERPIVVDAVASPLQLISMVFEQCPIYEPSARFAMETAVLDWLGHNRGLPVHRLLGGDSERKRIPIADLGLAEPAFRWPSEAERLVGAGATHLKLKVGVDFEQELQALQSIRAAHRALPIRLDANRKLSADQVVAHAAALESLDLELFEEPVPVDDWQRALDLPLPWALDETLRSTDAARRVLDSGKIRAVVLKPTVLGGLSACLAWAERAAAAGTASVVSHAFEGPIARAAAAELALALRCELAAGIGEHPALELWPPCRTAAIDARSIVEHDAFGLGLSFTGGPDE